MSWLVTIKTKLRHSVQLQFDDRLQPTRGAIVRQLHEMFPEMHVALRSELIERVNEKEYVVAVTEPDGALRQVRVAG